MRLDDERESDNVEDRRGMSMPGGRAGGIGIGTIALAFYVLDAPEIGGIDGLKAKLPASALDFFPTVGNTGAVDGWEVSTDLGNTWIPVANTTSSLTYSNLTFTTIYHAIVRNGDCNSATSSALSILL